MHLDNRIAVITGAASGIGRATAGAFARAGARLVLADIDEANGAKAAAELRAPNRTMLAELTPERILDALREGLGHGLRFHG